MRHFPLIAAATLLSLTAHPNERAPGSAVVRVDNLEYLVPIECKDAAQPWLGFATEPARVTRKRTGRTSMARLNLRPWRDTGQVIVSLNRYVAWTTVSPSLVGQTFSVVVDMSPASTARNGFPEPMTYDRWQEGDRPAGVTNVRIEANCMQRDEAAPAFKKG